MDWKKDLEKKAKEFNIKGGTENVQSRNNGRNINRDSNRWSSNVHLVGSNRKIKVNNIEPGGKMITIEGALKDLEAIEKETVDNGAKSIIKALKVVTKFLSTMRSNQLLTDEDKNRIANNRAKKQAKQ